MVVDPGTGPFVKAAILCEHVLEEKDGVLTPVRIIDRVVVQATGIAAPETLPAGKVGFTFLLMLVAGAARGGVNFSVRLEEPSSITERVLWQGSLDFPGPDDQGHNLIITTELEVKSAGLHWLDVYVDQVRVTRTPLRVSYARTSAPVQRR